MSEPSFEDIARIQGDELFALLDTVGDDAARFRLNVMVRTGDSSEVTSEDMDHLTIAIRDWLTSSRH